MMKVFACCSEEILPGLRQALASEFNFRFSTDAAETIRGLEANGAKLVVIEYGVDGSRDFRVLSEYLKKNAVPFVVLCRQAKDGFLVLKAGAADMLVIPPTFIGGKAGAQADGDKRRIEPIYFIESLRKLVRNFSQSGEMRTLKHPSLSDAHQGKVVLIGASTGGAEAVTAVLESMPPDCPPIVVAMHMPPVFTRMFAERVHSISKITVWEAADGDRLRRGLALIARGDTHVELRRNPAGYYVSVMEGPPIRHVRPCVDVLFSSAAKAAGRNALGVILTGMGKDGAEGLLDMKKAGAYTIGQDEATSIVYGMPKEASDIGAVSIQLPLDSIAGKILSSL